MNRAIVFGLVAAGGAVGGIAGIAAVGKAPKSVLSQVGYGPAGGLLFAAAVAALLWEPPQPCPPCPATPVVIPPIVVQGPRFPATTSTSTNTGIDYPLPR